MPADYREKGNGPTLARVFRIPNIQNEVALRVVSNEFESNRYMQMLSKEGNVEPIKHRNV